jgi:hypothetical protein
MTPNPALNPASFCRWTLRDNTAQCLLASMDTEDRTCLVRDESITRHCGKIEKYRLFQESGD